MREGEIAGCSPLGGTNEPESHLGAGGEGVAEMVGR
jgi:hypothetical protein